jgi:hypothetical protein
MTGTMFAWLIIALSACASAGYYLAGDLRHGTYWLAAAVLNLCVTVE